MTAYLLIFLLFHPIYISTSDVVFEDHGNWRGTIKIFYDDLEDALQDQGGKRPNLAPDNLVIHYSEMNDYLHSHLQFVQDSILTYQLVMAGREGDVVTIKIEGIDRWKPTEMSIRNTLLLDLFESQKNIMTIRRKTDTDFFYLRKGLTSRFIDLSD